MLTSTVKLSVLSEFVLPILRSSAASQAAKMLCCVKEIKKKKNMQFDE